MTDAYIFSGPTLPAALKNAMLREHGDLLTFVPPASEGDVLAILGKKPKIIGIIDGYFENIPAVWHKEILCAMDQGVHVLGGSSMGALRAAELALFGMEGIGRIYQSFASEEFEDDDEVTVAHGPAELGFPALSEAMVNIRYTLSAAKEAGVIDAESLKWLLHIAKDLYYKDRRYRNILAQAPRYGIGAERIAALTQWLETGRQDQKCADAVQLVQEVVGRLKAKNFQHKKTAYHFERTIIWERARSRANIF